MKPPYAHMTIRFSWIFLAATTMSVLVILEDFAGYLINGYEYAYSWFSVPAKALSNYWVWALLAPLIDRQARKISNTAYRWKGSNMASVIGAGLLIALLHRIIAVSAFDFSYYLKSGFYVDLFSEKNKLLITTGWISSMIQYAVILFLFFAVVYYRQYLQKQKELNQAQMRALKMQLHPHFLFNTLHSVAALIDIEPNSAQKMLSQLGRLMRHTLEQDEKETASLNDEFAYIRNYLDIEHVRFRDRLKIKYDLDEAVLTAAVPYLLLQPIVENAIKYGVQDMQEDGVIALCAKRNQDKVLVTISDNGTGLKKSNHGSGVGLKNVKERLNTFFGANYEFQAGREAGGYTVKISFPYIEFED